MKLALSLPFAQRFNLCANGYLKEEYYNEK